MENENLKRRFAGTVLKKILSQKVFHEAYLPVSKMNISLTIRFFPSPSRPPKVIRNWPNYVDEWQFRVEGGDPSSYYCPPAAAD